MMDNTLSDLPVDFEASAESSAAIPQPVNTITESSQGAASLSEQADKAPLEESVAPEKRSLARKFSHRIRTSVNGYLQNLDPRGKDKFWWAGFAVNSGISAALIFSTGGTTIPFVPSLIRTAASIGLIIGERKMYLHKEKQLTKHYSGEELSSRIADMQEKYVKGTSRMRKFMMGLAAGSIYAGVTELPLSAAGAIDWSSAGQVLTPHNIAEQAKAHATATLHAVEKGSETVSTEAKLVGQAAQERATGHSGYAIGRLMEQKDQVGHGLATIRKEIAEFSTSKIQENPQLLKDIRLDLKDTPQKFAHPGGNTHPNKMPLPQRAITSVKHFFSGRLSPK